MVSEVLVSGAAAEAAELAAFAEVSRVRSEIQRVEAEPTTLEQQARLCGLRLALRDAYADVEFARIAMDGHERRRWLRIMRAMSALAR